MKLRKLIAVFATLVMLIGMLPLSLSVSAASNNTNVLQNGDFESGTLSPWQPYQSTTISAEAAHSGEYGVIAKGKGDWGGTLKQTFHLEIGKTYSVSFWYKPISNGLNFTIKNEDGDKLLSHYLDSKHTTDWTKFEATFESAFNTSAYISFSGSGIKSTDEVWIDDVVIFNQSGDDMDRAKVLTDTGVSVRDTALHTRGLAFRFKLDVSNAQVEDRYHLVPNTGSIQLFKYSNEQGTLVETGAVLSYVYSVGGLGKMTLDNVDGKKTIQVPAKYVTDATADSISFAIRVINIPEKRSNTTIFARPYYIYERDGERVTVYGDTVMDTYTAVADARRSLKILAIGNSFSVDAMENHLYKMLESAKYDGIILGNLTADDCTLDQHWNYINGGSNAYAFRKTDVNGEWKAFSGYQALTALQEEDWDVITIQQASPVSGQADTYGNLQNIVSWVDDNKTNPNGKIYWHMTWAYQQDSTHAAFPTYGSSQMQMYNAIVDAAKNTAMKVEGIDGVIPAGTAIQNLRGTDLGDTLTDDGCHLMDTYGDYTAALTWYAAITGQSLDQVIYRPKSIAEHHYNLARAVAYAVYEPYAVSDLSETVLFAGSDFQPSNINQGITILQGLMGSLAKDGYGMFDGLLFVGDYTAALGSEHDAGVRGLNALKKEMAKYGNVNQVYSQGNHDAATIPGLAPYGNNDPLNGPYGVFVINEDNYNSYGAGGEKVAKDLNDYFVDKLKSGWGNKPIFVMSHLPLHYNYRTMKDKAGSSAMHIVNTLNAASDAGLNIIFLIAHNHSGGYDDYLGGAAIYIPKGDSILVTDPADYQNAPIETELRFTYMNAGYVSYYADMGMGADTALTMSTFRIQEDGSVIITRYDKDGIHNLKSAGKLSPHDPEYTSYTFADERVYASSRIVSAGVDEPYEE